MGAAPAGVACGAQRLAGAGEGGQLVGVRLDQVGAGGDAPPQGLAARVEQRGDAGAAGAAHQLPVRADVDAAREAAAQGDRLGPAEQFLVRADERRPLGGGDDRAGLAELGGVAGRGVDDGDGAAGGVRGGHQGVPYRQRGEQVAQDGSGGAAREARDDGLVAEGGQDAGHVDALAAGALGHVGDAVRGVRRERGHRVGEVERGVERDREDHRFQHPRSRGPASSRRPARRIYGPRSCQTEGGPPSPRVGRLPARRREINPLVARSPIRPGA